RLPGTLGLLLEGRISELQARAVTEASYVLPDDRLAGYEEQVLKRAPEQTLQQLRDVVRRAQHRLDPAGAEQRKRRAVADRSVRVTDAGDGLVDRAAAGRTRPRLPGPDRRGRPNGTPRGRTHPGTKARRR